MSLRQLVMAWAPVIAWAVLIFGLSAQSELRFVPDQLLDLIVRKAGHMFVFGTLALLIWRALAATTAVRRPWLWALLLAFLYAATDEFHQGFVAGRDPSPVDVAIDSLGAIIAISAVRITQLRRLG